MRIEIKYACLSVMLCVWSLLLSRPANAVSYWGAVYDLVHDAAGADDATGDQINATSPFAPADLLRPDYSQTSGHLGHNGVVIAPGWLLTAKHNVGVNGYKIGDQQAANYVAVPGGTHEHPTADIALIKLRNESNLTPVMDLPYVTLYDGDQEIQPGTRITHGSFGRRARYDEQTGARTDVQNLNEDLRWSRNIITSKDSSDLLRVAFDEVSAGGHIPYEGGHEVGDSGSGWYVRDGWDWKLVGIAREPNGMGTAPINAGGGAVSMYDYRDWILSTINNADGNASGGPDQVVEFVPTTRPTPTHYWNGGAFGEWGGMTWSGQPVPAYDVNHADIVEITASLGPNVGSATGTARAQDVYVGSNSQQARLAISSGGKLEAVAVFIGGNADEDGRLDMSGGDLKTDNSYVGVYGEAEVFQTGGTHQTHRLVIGKNSNIEQSYQGTYRLNGSSSVSDPSRIVADEIVLGGQVGAEGRLRVATGSYAEVVTDRLIVGDRGNGRVLHYVGDVVIEEELVLGNGGGAGEYLFKNGTLTARNIDVNAGSTFGYSGGTFQSHQSGDGFRMNLSGKLILDGATFSTKHLSIGAGAEVDFNSNTGTLNVETIADFSDATFANHQNAFIDVALDKMIIVDQATAAKIDAGSLDVRQGGGLVTELNAAVHVLGTTLTIGNAESVSGSATLTDRVVVQNGGSLLGGNGGPPSQGNSGSIRLEDGIEVDASSTVDLGTYGSLVVQAGSPASAINSGATSFRSGTIFIESGGELIAEGRLVRPVLGVGDLTGIGVAGKLTVGDIQSADTLTLSSGAVDSNMNETGSVFATSDVNAVVELDLFDQSGVVVSDKIIAGDVILSGGTLSLSTAPSEVNQLSFGQSVELIETMPSAFYGNGESVVSGVFSEVQYADASVSVFLDPSGDGSATNDGKLIAVVYKDEIPAGAALSSCDGICAFIAAPGDFNLDGDVNFDDYLILSDNHGDGDGMTWVHGDANGDGVVDDNDFWIWQDYNGQTFNYGGTASSLASVPEPSTILMTLCAFAPPFLRRRR